jgi:dUTP pyrophosphatase
MNIVQLKWKKLRPHARIPVQASSQAACFDLSLALEADEEIVLEPGQIYALSTGLAVEIPSGFEMQVRARSGLALKSGLCLVNGVGTIDSDYRGELKAIVTLLGKQNLRLKNGDRIAQALVANVTPVMHLEVEALGETVRGAGGFGSTGVSGGGPGVSP